MGRASRFLVAGACAALLAAAGAQAQERLEIFSWWTDGDGGSGLQTLVQQYNARFPDVAVTNAAAAVGPGVDARTVLRLRMLAGNPPDSFQVHGGQELFGTWVAANRMEDLSGFYRIQGLMNKLPRSFISLLSSKTGIWSIPLAVNRTNVIWFIPSRLQAWGVTPPRTWDELIAACRKLKDGGLETPLAAGGPTALGSLWECAALASLGPASWNELWAGKVRFTDPQALRAWDNFGPAAELANQDASEISWQQAIDRLVKGQAAFAIMGDWAAGYMSGALKLVPGTDFAWAPSPGTAGAFMASCDTFDLPRGQKNRASVLKWLVLISSREGQDVFNPPAGSISPRLDSDLSLYGAYSQSAARDWRRDAIVGSLVQGTAAPPSFASQFPDALGVYLSTRDSRAAANAAQAIADQVGLGK